MSNKPLLYRAMYNRITVSLNLASIMAANPSETLDQHIKSEGLSEIRVTLSVWREIAALLEHDIRSAKDAVEVRTQQRDDGERKLREMEAQRPNNSYAVEQQAAEAAALRLEQRDLERALAGTRRRVAR